MRALITNDDGIDSAGLYALALAACRQGFEVVVAAPAQEASGSSASIIATDSRAVTAAGGRGHIRIEDRTFRGLDVPAHAVHAAPALIALVAAHGAFGPPPDLVLSGINRGANVGRAILHSGTVGAALTGGGSGARALAVSLATGLYPDPPRWSMAAAVTERVLALLAENAPGTILNLNVPNVHEEPELVEASLAPFGIVHTTVSRRVGDFVSMTIAEPPGAGEEDTDAALLAAGKATLTRLLGIAASPEPVLLTPAVEVGGSARS
ncbi:5'/3'-nucleotidase SurE [Agromyces bauzanensis]|uniref:5'-nucleotidase n=1 Tax=Agromyces bauzanensis TaxID=1308924 RepID=A0A917PNQ0_9MICO|nr:5'/3'-nucleotidase SurE [Agromyces bauzanensis]GGJ85167.1 5'/3'-nucleotidase SurE [Agromyces bauzanensis]